MKKTEFFEQSGKRFFFDDPVAVANYLKENFPQDCARTIKAADDVAQQRFLFNLRWDMERTTEPVVFDGEIDWLHQPGDDPEWVYAFNRMRFWICLGQAYALTGDERYAQSFVRQLRGWVAAVRPDDPRCQKAWRSIEVGLRLEYWLKAIRYFAASPHVDDEVVALFCGSVTEHAEFLMGVWDTFHLMSNWGVLANHGLFMAGVMLPDSPRARVYADEAARRLGEGLAIQVYRDGSHWEQSPMYHNEVLACYLDVVTLAQRNAVALPDNIMRQVRDMCHVDLFAAKPNHHELCMGDSDDIDQRDLLVRGAVVFADGVLKSRAYAAPDYDSAWDIGEVGLRDYAALPAALPAVADKALYDSGNFYLRSGWEDDATYLHFHCGTLGAGHGHADKLHVDLFSRGEDVLVDAGRYTYVFDGGRVAFKELRAHNTLMVDGQDRYVCKDSWACHDLTRGINARFFADDRYGYAEGGHLAYMDLGVYVNRRVIYLKPDLVVLVDAFYTSGAHSYEQFFHFGERGTLEGEGARYLYRGERVCAQMVLSAEGVSGEMGESMLSRHYNCRETNRMVTARLAGQGFVGAFTVIALSDAGKDLPALSVEPVPVRSNFKGIVFADRQVQARTIRFGAQHFTVVVAHEEFASPTDTFLADGCTGFGSCVVFDRAAGESEIGTVLLW